MAQTAGTASRYSAIGAREDLEDTIWELFPEDTWFLTNADKITATNVLHEWQTDSLATPGSNREHEGFAFSASTLTPTVRISNRCQISAKTFIVSGTLEAAKLAGRRSEIARAGMKLMRELKRDMEYALITNQASSAGSPDTNPRSMGGLESYIAGPTRDATAGAAVIRATTTAGGTTAGFSSGDVVSPTDPSVTAALTVGALNFALQGSWSNGGDPRVILCGATQKTAIDAFTSIATRMVDIDRRAQAVITNAANVFVSDYGVHTVVLSRYLRSSIVFGLDPDFLAVAFYRRPFMEPVAKIGDAERRMLISEYTLVVRNPSAHAKVVGCA